MRMFVIKKFLLLIFSSSAGLLAGGMVVTPVFALMNYPAQDGPIFPAPMIAFVVVAPISIFLLAIQGCVLACEWIAKRSLGKASIWIGLAGGLVAGLIPYFLAIAAYQSDSEYGELLAFGGPGMFQGLTIFSPHWIANKLKLITAG